MIYVMGSSNVDFFMELDNLPIMGETIISKSLEIKCGGKGANQAVAAHKSGGYVKFFSCVGNDSNGQFLLDKYRDYNIDTKDISIITMPTGTAMIFLHNCDNMIIVNSGANHVVNNLNISNFLGESKRGDIFLTQLEMPNENVFFGLKLAKKSGMTTVLNAAPMNDFAVEMLSEVDILIVNEIELSMIAPEDGILASCQKINDKNDVIIIVTRGSKGHAIFEKGRWTKFEAHKVDVVDSTGAGDTFCGVFATALSKGYNIYEASKYAAKAASIAIKQKGAQEAMPFEKELF